MAEKRESNGTRIPQAGKGPRIGNTPAPNKKFHDDAFRIKNVIIEREIHELRHLTYDEVVAVLSIYNEEQEPKILGIDKANGKDLSALTIKVDVDCSDALKGLKAVTREVKKVSAALEELDRLKEHTKAIGISVHLNGNEIAKSFKGLNECE